MHWDHAGDLGDGRNHSEARWGEVLETSPEEAAEAKMLARGYRIFQTDSKALRS